MDIESDAFGTLSFDDVDDDVASLSPDFEALSAAFWATRSSYISGGMPHELAALRFQALRLLDSSGTEWTLGATSSSWYTRAPGCPWSRSGVPPIAAVVSRTDVPLWVTAGIESVGDGSDTDSSDERSREDGFNPFQRKSQPLLASSVGNVRPRSESDLEWVYEDWEAEDFSSGVPGSLDSARALSDSFSAEAPVDRVMGDPQEGFDLDSLFLKPE